MSLKARFDYFKYVLTIKKKKTMLFLINLGIFITLTVYNITQFSSDNFNIIIFVINILTLINVIINIYSIRNKIKALFFIKKPFELTIQEIPLPKTVIPSEIDEQYGYKNILIKNHQLIRSEEVDDYLMNCDLQDIKILYKINKKYINKIRKKNMQNDIKLIFLRNEFNKMLITRPLINEKKYSLATEIVPEQNIEIFKSTYYDSILTNSITRKKIYKNNNGFEELFFDGTTMLPFSDIKDDSCRLMPIKQTKMNNHVGTSVLGLTSDKYLILFYQGKSYIDTKFLVPSENGSADWNDLRKMDGNFINAIKYSMERELIEEAMPKNKKYKINTKRRF